MLFLVWAGYWHRPGNRHLLPHVLSGIQRLLDDAQQAKPAIAQLADHPALRCLDGVQFVVVLMTVTFTNREGSQPKIR